MKIALLCVTTQTVLNFRMSFIKKLQKAGHQVSVICFDNAFQKEIEAEGIGFSFFENSNRSLNPLAILSLVKNYKQKLSIIQPDLVFTFMAKPNIFGTRAAHKLGIQKIFSMVEGAGDPFIKTGFKWTVIRKAESFLYKRSFRYSQKVFFLNQDDLSLFVSLGLMDAQKAHIIPGIGVDVRKFAYQPTDKNSNAFLMVARLLTTKGVWDYVHCAELVKARHPEAVFGYLGAEGDITLMDLKPYTDRGILSYYGTTTDVRPYLYDSLALVLPSMREGLPMSVMEAESCGRAILTYDSVGCRDTAVHGENGFIVPQNDVEALAGYCEKLLEDKDLCARMGDASRRLCETRFDQEVINSTLLKEIEA